MITKPTDIHVHRFTKKATRTVLLYKQEKMNGSAAVSGKDKLLLRLCKCGKYQAYDLERTLA